MFYILLIFQVAFSNGFLLDTNNPPNSLGQSGTSKQYLTVSEYYDDKKQRQRDTVELRHEMGQVRHETEQLRTDTDKTLAFLTSQLQQKLALLDQKIQTKNETRKYIENLEENYNLLLENNTILRHDFDKLMQKYGEQGMELIELKNKTQELEKRLKIANLNATMIRKTQEDELSLVKNTTLELSRKIAEIEQLKTIQQSMDLRDLKNQVRSISMQTQKMSINERARAQDFLALYNETLASKRAISNLELQTTGRLLDIEKDQNLTLTLFQDFSSSQNVTLGTVDQKFQLLDERIQKVDSNLKEFQKRENITNTEIQQQFEKVALTSCHLSEHTYSSGKVIKFTVMKFVIGVNDVSLFQSTGQFTCDKPGLYLVSVSIVSLTSLANFYLQKNGQLLINPYISSDSHIDAGTVVFAVDLKINDKIWVESSSSLHVDDNGSCLTVVRLK